MKKLASDCCGGPMCTLQDWITCPETRGIVDRWVCGFCGQICTPIDEFATKKKGEKK